MSYFNKNALFVYNFYQRVKIKSENICFVLILFIGTEVFSQPLPVSLSLFSCPVGVVDLTIYDGVSGLEVPDAIEAITGATSVANKNDTDADSYPDNNDPVVISGPSGVGEDNDRDLMKLVLHKPSVYYPGHKINLKIVPVPSGEVGHVKVWRTPDKNAIYSVPLPAKFNYDELPLTLYVEATSESKKEKDINIQMEYNGDADEVFATAIWLKNTGTWLTRCTPGDCGNPTVNPEAGVGRLKACGGFLPTVINNSRISWDGSRFGHGTNIRISSTDDRGFGGRILFEFTFYPLGVDPTTLGVYFDCTRQRMSRTMRVPHGAVPGYDYHKSDYTVFSDIANDDTDNEDEDNIADVGLDPLEGYRIYAWDAPGLTATQNDANTTSFWASRNNFNEFVRVRMDGTFPEDGAGLLGSRASDKVGWSMVGYVVSGPNNMNMKKDDGNLVSHSFPKKSGPGNGTIAVNLLANAANAGYETRFNSSVQKWDLYSPFGSTAGPIATSGPFTGGVGGVPRAWELIYIDKINLTITEGSTPFNAGSSFYFSTFKTTLGKINELKLGHTTVEDNKY